MSDSTSGAFVKVWLDDETMSLVDNLAGLRNETRSECVRSLVSAALDNSSQASIISLVDERLVGFERSLKAVVLGSFEETAVSIEESEQRLRRDIGDIAADVAKERCSKNSGRRSGGFMPL